MVRGRLGICQGRMGQSLRLTTSATRWCSSCIAGLPEMMRKKKRKKTKRLRHPSDVCVETMAATTEGGAILRCFLKMSALCFAALSWSLQFVFQVEHRRDGGVADPPRWECLFLAAPKTGVGMRGTQSRGGVHPELLQRAWQQFQQRFFFVFFLLRWDS